MEPSPHEPETASTWSQELAQRNVRGGKVAVALVCVLYPAFGVLDVLIAPPETLPLLLSSRAFVVLLSALMWWALKRERFEERTSLLTSSYMYVVALGICVMIFSLGGLSSPYYAGLNLVMIGTGLLYVWPLKVSATLNAGICLAWLLPSWLLGEPLTETERLVNAISNGFFLFSTACITTAGQTFNYHRLFSQFKTRRALEETSAELAEAHDQLKRQEAFKSRFFANITHELKTPLALILSTLELMKRGELGERLEDQLVALDQMERSGGKLLRLINDLLDITKLEESRLLLDVAEHELVEWARGILSEVEPLAERKLIRVSLSSSAERLPIYCDLYRLERVLVNLLSNAIKFTPERGEIEVSLSELDDRVQLQVRDTGQGFSPEQAARLFDRFYQTDMGATRKHGGTGLGLTLAKELIELHHGRIWATGQEGSGATFTIELFKGAERFDGAELQRGRAALRAQHQEVKRITGEQLSAQHVHKIPLPRALKESLSEHLSQPEPVAGEQVSLSELGRLAEIDEVSERRVIPRDADEDERGATALIAEDHPDITKMIHLALKRHFKVVAAPDGAKALELIERFKPDIVITDLMMPVMDGMALTEAIKSQESTASIPVIMLSARDGIQEEMRERGFVADAYMSKPFSTRALGRLARDTLKASRVEGSTQADS